MRIALRVPFLTVVSVAFLVATGCSTDNPSADGEHSETKSPVKLDACQIAKPEVLSKLGLPTKGEPDSSISDEPGCLYQSSRESIVISSNSESGFEEYANRPVWSEFERHVVNGRPAAKARTSQYTEDQCSQVISAGGGVVVVDAMSGDPRKPFDACGEALKVVEQIEPDLPK